jgi:dihydroflavonol-4-reductase
MILVTGATGFLGRNLLPRLVAEGHMVRALVRPGSDTKFLQRRGVELATVDDITDRNGLAQACRGVEQIVHAAGRFRFWGDDAAFRKTNVEGTRAILSAALAAGVQRFLHVSTIVVIGQTPETGTISEQTRCQPQEPYQSSKLEAEQLVLEAYRERGLPALLLRPGAYYGPWGRYAFNRLFFEEPLRGWRIKINRGRHVTFPAYVPDVVQAILLALDQGQAGEIYNICSQSLEHNVVNGIVSDLANIGHWRINIPTSAVLSLARAWTVLSRFTHREPFYPINMKSYVFQDWHVSTEKAERELGFVATPFREGARATLEWYWGQGLLKKR